MHEDLLRHIWSKQLFDVEKLVTTEGNTVRVIQPGILHRGSGPDFRNAKIEIAGKTFFGDIEFHRTVEDWQAHNHDKDPAYNTVILHVVLQGKSAQTFSKSGRTIHTVILEPFLLSSVEAISDQLAREEYTSRITTIRCSATNDEIPPEMLRRWIHQVYRERLEEKTRRLYERLCDTILTQQKNIGEPHPPYDALVDPNDIPLPNVHIEKDLFRQKLPWEQVLYEEVMDGFGYSNNREPMKKLAENISLLQLLTINQLREGEKSVTELSVLQLQSVLFKASGLLPELSELGDQDSKVFVHQLHSTWKELKTKPSFAALHKTEWNFSPTRPSNFPTIRIAAASIFVHKLLYESFFRSIIIIIGGKFSSPQIKIEQLLNLFELGGDPFWNYHYTFTEAVHKPHSLLGESRKHDILINTIIPFVCLYANIFGKKDLAEHCLNIAVELPLLEDNSILTQMHKQLLKGKIKIEHAFQQQGILQLYRKYCTKNRCAECEVGKTLHLQ